MTTLTANLTVSQRSFEPIDSGDPKAAEELLPLVYEELRHLAAQKMAQERPGQTLQATAVVAGLLLVATVNRKRRPSLGPFAALHNLAEVWSPHRRTRQPRTAKRLAAPSRPGPPHRWPGWPSRFPRSKRIR